MPAVLSRDEWIDTDLVGLARLTHEGAVTPAEVLETAIREIERLNPIVNAVVVEQFDRALANLAEVGPGGRFAGMPYLIKDLHAPVAGMPLANSSVPFENTVYDFDSTTVARLRSAGFGLLGRTASAEFGLSVETASPLWGTTNNPWHRDHGAGGSSGGAAAAVASGMLPAAHATDSAGSIRIPAAFNGLVGLKPTRGLLAFGPHRGDINFGLSHEHAVTRSVRDSAALLDVTAGPNPGRPYFTPRPAEPFETLITQPPTRLTIGYVLTRFDGGAVHPESARAVEETAAMLERLGHVVEERGPVFDADRLNHVMIRLLLASLAGLFAGVSTSDDELDGLQEITKAAVRYAAGATLQDYLQGAAEMNQHVRQLSSFFETHDVLVTPTTNGPAPRHGTLPMDHSDLDRFLDDLFRIAPFTAPFNASGQPAISLPMRHTDAGLPVGVQLVGDFADDAILLRLAHQLETAAAWRCVAEPSDPDHTPTPHTKGSGS